MTPDIIERLMDYEGHGATATDRVKLREEAAVEIFKLRAERQSLRNAIEKVRSYNVDIQRGRINYRPEDHIKVLDGALS